MKIVFVILFVGCVFGGVWSKAVKRAVVHHDTDHVMEFLVELDSHSSLLDDHVIRTLFNFLPDQDVSLPDETTVRRKREESQPSAAENQVMPEASSPIPQAPADTPQTSPAPAPAAPGVPPGAPGVPPGAPGVAPGKGAGFSFSQWFNSMGETIKAAAKKVESWFAGFFGGKKPAAGPAAPPNPEAVDPNSNTQPNPNPAMP